MHHIKKGEQRKRHKSLKTKHKNQLRVESVSESESESVSESELELELYRPQLKCRLSGREGAEVIHNIRPTYINVVDAFH